MRRYLSALALSSAIAATLIGCGGSSGGSATPTPAPTAAPTPTPVPTPTPTPTPTPVPTRSFNVAVTGARGSVAIGVNGVASTIVLGTPATVSTPISGSNLLSAPAAYGDRAFVAWQYKGTNFSTAATLSALPDGLANGETLTAVYGPAGTRTGLLTPNYNQTDYSFWPSAQLPVKIFFDASVSADQKTLILEGIERWVKALGSGVSYTLVGTEGEATLTLKMGAVAVAVAQTTTTASSATPPKPLISAVTTFDPAQIPALNTPVNRDTFVALAAHEFGHALGISGGGVQGHSSNPLDIMFGTVSVDNRTITERDINTMMNIYSSLYDGRHRAMAPSTPQGGSVTKTIYCNVRWQ